MRKQTMTSLRKKLDKVFAEYVRARDGNVCYTCGQPGNQAGHFFSRNHFSVRWDETNVHCQCVRCNLTLGGNVHAYIPKFVEQYGRQAYYDLQIKANTIAKHSNDWMLEQINYYTKKMEIINAG